MPQGQPAVELPGEDLLAQYRTHVRTDGTQPFADLDQHTALEAKPLTDAQRLGRGEYLRPAQEVGKGGRRLARASRSGAQNSLAQRLEDRPASLDGCVWTADNESQLAGLCVLRGAVRRSVHHIDIGEGLSAVGTHVGKILRQQVLTRQFDSGLPLGHLLKSLVTDSSIATACGVEAPLLAACRD